MRKRRSLSHSLLLWALFYRADWPVLKHPPQRAAQLLERHRVFTPSGTLPRLRVRTTLRRYIIILYRHHDRTCREMVEAYNITRNNSPCVSRPSVTLTPSEVSFMDLGQQEIIKKERRKQVLRSDEKRRWHIPRGTQQRANIWLHVFHFIAFLPYVSLTNQLVVSACLVSLVLVPVALFFNMNQSEGVKRAPSWRSLCLSTFPVIAQPIINRKGLAASAFELTWSAPLARVFEPKRDIQPINELYASMQRHFSHLGAQNHCRQFIWSSIWNGRKRFPVLRQC